VSRRLSVVVGFYRVCVIDAILPHSPADYVRRPTVPAESPTLGLGHLQPVPPPSTEDCLLLDCRTQCPGDPPDLEVAVQLAYRDRVQPGGQCPGRVHY
jgi:hypothetical protein